MAGVMYCAGGIVTTDGGGGWGAFHCGDKLPSELALPALPSRHVRNSNMASLSSMSRIEHQVQFKSLI